MLPNLIIIIKFDSSTNSITIESPIDDYEFMRYTVIVDSEDKIRDNSTYTLCGFINDNIDKMGKYRK